MTEKIEVRNELWRVFCAVDLPQTSRDLILKHIAVLRASSTQSARTLATAHLEMAFSPVEVVVSELLVIRSELSSAGSRYTVASRHLLGEGE